MDTMKAFGRAQAARGHEMKVFDWDKAAKLIVEHGIKNAGAGLSGDLEWTGGAILKNGEPVKKEDTYTFLASNWATPVLTTDDDEIACYIMESEIPDAWGENSPSDYYWPADTAKVAQGVKSD